MEFDITADQKMMQDSVDRTLERVCPLDRVRKANGRADDVRQALAELGVTGLLIPEDHGGLGLKLLDAALAAEMLGKHVAPVPFVAGAVMAPLAILGAGSAAQQTKYLPRLASGEAIASVAVSEQAAGARDNGGVTAKGGKLSGKALFVLDFEGADIVVVADRFGGLHIVDARAKGLEKTALTTIDATRTAGELAFDNVDAEPLTAGNPQAALDRMIDAGRIVLAADTLGAGMRMIDKAVAYAKERMQFGRVIGSFQAVKHLCAEMVAELEPCRALIWYAAYAFDEFPTESRRMAAHAKAHTSEVGTFVARTATEVHGGMGFTDLLGLHYWFKRIGFDRQALGGPERARHDAAVAQGWIAN
ncbi:MAG TPA: acyl-CoA dehydrogenase family protein [Rhizomicrobium sp.]|jgi:alkylation response protein AidB-like acyl-CoA dehydrogenase|nr:acyl-CoA dehydrogenase family protein [Rhizomicrobium sp.]